MDFRNKPETLAEEEKRKTIGILLFGFGGGGGEDVRSCSLEIFAILPAKIKFHARIQSTPQTIPSPSALVDITEELGDQCKVGFAQFLRETIHLHRRVSDCVGEGGVLLDPPSPPPRPFSLQ